MLSCLLHSKYYPSRRSGDCLLYLVKKTTGDHIPLKWCYNRHHILYVAHTHGISFASSFDFKGILPKGPYLPCVSMAGRALLAGYHRILYSIPVIAIVYVICYHIGLVLWYLGKLKVDTLYSNIIKCQWRNIDLQTILLYHIMIYAFIFLFIDFSFILVIFVKLIES